jgi:transcriptional regulator with XRE-family HTH domain
LLNKNAIGIRVSEIRKKLNLRQVDFAKEVEISQQALSQIEHGTILPSLDLLQKITSKYSIDYNFIIDGKAVLKNYKAPLSTFQAKEDTFNLYNGVPYYEELIASAGDVASFLQTAQPVSYVNLPQIKDCQAVLFVHGSSMKGVVEPGDLIAIKELKSRDEFDPALPYMIITEEHRMIKYLRADDNDASIIWAESTNHVKIKLNTDNIKMIYAIKCVIRFF